MALTDNQEAYYKCDGDATDATPNGNDGTVSGATLTTGKINQCYSYDGSNDYISLPSMNLGTSFTFNAWIKTTSSSRQYIVDFQSVRIIMAVDTGGNLAHFDGTWRNSGDSVNDGVFNMVTLVKNGTSYNMYLNGVEVSSGTGNSRNVNSIGSISDDNTFASFDGEIDEVGIWSRNLSPTEITELYNSGIGLQYPYDSVAIETNALFLGGGL